MDLGIIPMRYAKALLRFATEGHEEDRVYAEMTSLAQSFVKLPALQQAMINPVVTDEQKLQLLLTAVAKKHQKHCNASSRWWSRSNAPHP